MVGSIAGVRKYINDVFGDAVNITSRMEPNGSAMKVNVSESTYNLVKERSDFTKMGEVEV